MKRLGKEVIGSLFWMAAGLFFAFGGVRLNVGTLRNPGPGFVPFIIALLQVFFSLFTLIKGVTGPIKPLRGIPWRRPFLVVASVFFYGLLLDWVGFFISTSILMFILFYVLIRSKNRWPKVCLYAAATALAAWLIFSVALSVPFPSGRITSVWR